MDDRDEDIARERVLRATLRAVEERTGAEIKRSNATYVLRPASRVVTRIEGEEMARAAEAVRSGVLLLDPTQRAEPEAEEAQAVVDEPMADEAAAAVDAQLEPEPKPEPKARAEDDDAAEQARIQEDWVATAFHLSDLPEAEAEAPEESGDEEAVEAAAPQVLDEAALERLVARLIRQELAGELGERMTRNLRKMVRREITRTLERQRLD